MVVMEMIKGKCTKSGNNLRKSRMREKVNRKGEIVRFSESIIFPLYRHRMYTSQCTLLRYV